MGGKERHKAVAIDMIEIELDKKRTLDFDLNALASAEKAMSEFWGTRVTMGSILSEGTIGAADTRAMVWAGLLHDDPDLTVEQVGQMVRIDNLNYVQGKLMESLTAQGLIVPSGDGASGGGSSKPIPSQGS